MIKNLMIINYVLDNENVEKRISIITKIKICSKKNINKYFIGKKYRVPYDKNKTKKVGTIIFHDEIKNEYIDFFTHQKYRILEPNKLSGVNEKIDIQDVDTKIKKLKWKEGYYDN